jgi:hypothetical protein
MRLQNTKKIHSNEPGKCNKCFMDKKIHANELFGSDFARVESKERSGTWFYLINGLVDLGSTCIHRHFCLRRVGTYFVLVYVSERLICLIG